MYFGTIINNQENKELKMEKAKIVAKSIYQEMDVIWAKDNARYTKAYHYVLDKAIERLGLKTVTTTKPKVINKRDYVIVGHGNTTRKVVIEL